jgi:dGTP triphosphohydrolase
MAYTSRKVRKLLLDVEVRKDYVAGMTDMFAKGEHERIVDKE